jgi:ABC-type uncharacterized transport system fused permease/ATPase subunit
MSIALTILVVILGIALLVLLVLAIVGVVLFIKILRNVRKISERAEDVTTNFADIAAMVGKRVAPVALSAAMAAAMRRFKSKKE